MSCRSCHVEMYGKKYQKGSEQNSEKVTITWNISHLWQYTPLHIPWKNTERMKNILFVLKIGGWVTNRIIRYKQTKKVMFDHQNNKKKKSNLSLDIIAHLKFKTTWDNPPPPTSKRVESCVCICRGTGEILHQPQTKLLIEIS